MAETLGSLCDKLTIVKLKQWHSGGRTRQASLAMQQNQLQREIDDFLRDAVDRKIPHDRLRFSANKVFKKTGNKITQVAGGFGTLVALLAEANCNLWHLQEKVYNFGAIPAEEKNAVIKKLALTNLERNQCIDKIDELFTAAIANKVDHFMASSTSSTPIASKQIGVAKTHRSKQGR